MLSSEWVVGILNWEVEMISAVHSEGSGGVEEYQVSPEVHPAAFQFWIENITTPSAVRLILPEFMKIPPTSRVSHLRPVSTFLMKPTNLISYHPLLEIIYALWRCSASLHLTQPRSFHHPQYGAYPLSHLASSCEALHFLPTLFSSITCLHSGLATFASDRARFRSFFLSGWTPLNCIYDPQALLMAAWERGRFKCRTAWMMFSCSPFLYKCLL